MALTLRTCCILTAASIVATSSALAQSEPENYHPACAIDILSGSSEFANLQRDLSWTKELLTATEEVYCDEYAAADLTPGGVRTRLRHRLTFFTNNLNVTTIDTDGFNTPTSVLNRWDTDSSGQYTGLPYYWYSPAIETDSGYIFDQGSGYLSCCYTTTDQPLRASGVSPECIDSDNDGWGWNGTESCQTASDGAGSCDYTDATAHDGWGWNASTGQSCEPLTITTDQGTCDYSLADSQEGWGWNATTRASCPPTEESLQIYINQVGECDYQDSRTNNGWGWNRTTGASCPPVTQP